MTASSPYIGFLPLGTVLPLTTNSSKGTPDLYILWRISISIFVPIGSSSKSEDILFLNSSADEKCSKNTSTKLLSDLYSKYRLSNHD